jgi:hypothetical protein
MARPRRIDPELVVEARAVVAQATDAKTLRAAQAVLMPALAHTTLEQTAALLGVKNTGTDEMFTVRASSQAIRREWGLAPLRNLGPDALLHA